MWCFLLSKPSKRRCVGLLFVVLLTGQDILAVRKTCWSSGHLQHLSHANETAQSCKEVQNRLRVMIANKLSSDVKGRMLNGINALVDARFILRIIENQRECFNDRDFLQAMHESLQSLTAESGLGSFTIGLVNEEMSSVESTLGATGKMPSTHTLEGTVNNAMQKITIGVILEAANRDQEKISKDVVAEAVTKYSRSGHALADQDDDEDIVPLDKNGITALQCLLESYDEFVKDSLEKVAASIKTSAALREYIEETLPHEADSIPPVQEFALTSRSVCAKTNVLLKAKCPANANKTKTVVECIENEAKQKCKDMGATGGKRCTGIQVKWGGMYLYSYRELRYYLIDDITACKPTSKAGKVVSVDYLESPSYPEHLKTQHEAVRFYDSVLTKARKQAASVVSRAVDADGNVLLPSFPGSEKCITSNDSLIEIHSNALSGFHGQEANWLQNQNSIADLSEADARGAFFKWWFQLAGWLILGLPAAIIIMAIIVPFRVLGALLDITTSTALFQDRGNGFVEGIFGTIFDIVGQYVSTIYATLRCFLTGLLKAVGHVVGCGWIYGKSVCHMSYFTCLYHVISSYDDFAWGTHTGTGFFDGGGFVLYGYNSYRTELSKISRLPQELGLFAAGFGEDLNVINLGST